MRRTLAPSLLGALFLALLLYGDDAVGKNILVSSQDEYREAVGRLRPGDSVVLQNGVWRDFEILFTGTGTEKRPIRLTAETKGKVILSGQSNLRIAGKHLEVSGLVFRDGYTPTNTVISYRRNKKDLAYHSRVTEVVIDNFNNPERYEVDFWVMMYGKHNRFDHNHLVGKRNVGVTMAVRLDTEESRENHHRIDHNYFGPRPVLGSNGGETLRIGTSHYSLSDSHTLVENNYFDRCNGEVEIVSSKSGSNVFRGNLFFESQGTLTMRHGNGTLVEGNVFLGNGVPHTGGIRVINKRQTVRNNYLSGLTGHRFGGALVIMNGVPNSPINRYHQVENSVVENNSIMDSEHLELAAGSDAERSAVPITSVFRNNLVYNEDGRDIIAVHDDVSGIDFENNLLNDVREPTLTRGFASRSIDLKQRADGLLFPKSREFADIGAHPDIKVLKKSDTGVSWYPKPAALDPFESGQAIDVKDSSALVKAVAKAAAGDVIALVAGTHVVDRTLAIDKPITIRSANSRKRARLEFERSALFQIDNGGSLKLVNLDISGASAPDFANNSVVRTSRYSMLHNYTLVVEDCNIVDLNTNHTFNFLNAAKHTFADRIEISGSTFQNVTGSIVTLAREIEDLGIYNGEWIVITESRFRNIEGALANIYRGGTDESTFGPHVVVSGSILSNVGNGKRNKSGASIRLHGVQDARIEDNAFDSSGRVDVTETVGEPKTMLARNKLVATDAPNVTQWVRR